MMAYESPSNMNMKTEKATFNVLDDWLGFVRYKVQTQAQSNDRHNYVYMEGATTTCQTYLQSNVKCIVPVHQLALSVTLSPDASTDP